MKRARLNGLVILLFVGALSTRTLNGRVEEVSRTDIQLTIGLVVGLTALITPWLFEISRLVFEVALLPLALGLFLLAVIRATTSGIGSGQTAS